MDITIPKWRKGEYDSIIKSKIGVRKGRRRRKISIIKLSPTYEMK